MSSLDVLPVGVIVERRKIDNPWQEYKWQPLGVIVGGPPMQPWTILVQDEGWTQFMAGITEIELHRKETDAYKYNLESPTPSLYVVLRNDSDGEHPLKVHLVTASPFEAEAYMESGEETVDAVPMPAGIAQWLSEYIDAHHVEEPFKKRQRDKVRIDEHKFGQEPIVTLRQRMARNNDD